VVISLDLLSIHLLETKLVTAVARVAADTYILLPAIFANAITSYLSDDKPFWIWFTMVLGRAEMKEIVVTIALETELCANTTDALMKLANNLGEAKIFVSVLLKMFTPTIPVWPTLIAKVVISLKGAIITLVKTDPTAATTLDDIVATFEKAVRNASLMLFTTTDAVASIAFP